MGYIMYSCIGYMPRTGPGMHIHVWDEHSPCQAMLQICLKCLRDTLITLIINPLERINGVVPSGWISNIRISLKVNNHTSVF